MKKIIVMLMLLAPVAVFAQKFGHVDTQAIIQSLPEVSKVNGELEALGKQYQNELQAMQDEINRKDEEYQKTKSTMNATKQQETEAAINQLFQKYQQALQDNQQAFQKAQAEKMQPIQEKIMKAIENVAKAGGYVYIMERGVGQPIYISETLSKDVTSDVKAELNKMK
ncbi:MAG: OmpH family outer membrane protein [Prevotella sp.]|nr:OmpH family outer membrane protein [Prevotella sp.]MBR5929503.1 OmpH family outer membrane protein [Prevotella sp.]